MKEDNILEKGKTTRNKFTQIDKLQALSQQLNDLCVNLGAHKLFYNYQCKLIRKIVMFLHQATFLVMHRHCDFPLSDMLKRMPQFYRNTNLVIMNDSLTNLLAQFLLRYTLFNPMLQYPHVQWMYYHTYFHSLLWNFDSYFC